METLCSDTCEWCIHGCLIPDEKMQVRSYCSIKEKSFVYGCYISCDDFKSDKEREQQAKESKAIRIAERKKKEKKVNGKRRSKSK